MSSPFELQRGSEQLVDLQEQLPQMHKCTLPCAGRQAGMANMYSLLEWGIPKSTHPNNEMYGVCK